MDKKVVRGESGRRGRGGKPRFNRGGRRNFKKQDWREKKEQELKEKNLEAIKSDDRFTKTLRDPRFKSISKRQSKVEIDSRFSSILNKKNSIFKSKSKVDKFGRRLTGDEDTEDLSKFYVEKKERRFKSKREEEEEESEEEEENDENVNDSDSDDSSSEDEMIEMDETAMTEFNEEENEEVDEVEEGNETSRLAAMNMDWTMVKSVDILAMLTSFVPKSGAILKVSVYPSEYGVQKLAEEDAQGPPPEIFAAPAKVIDSKKSKKSEDDDDDEEEEEEEEEENSEEEEEEIDEDGDEDGENEDDEDGDGDDFEGMSLEELENLLKKEKESYKKDVFEEEGLIEKSDNDDDEEKEKEDEEEEEEEDKPVEDNGDDGFNQEELRKYEKSRMRYFFAVIECDSVATANVLYENCDGVQLVNSSNALDLRYIPDDTTFKYPPRDTATEVPANYKPPSRNSIAVDQTNVRLTWDETPHDRIALTRQDFKKSGKTDRDLEDDFKAYLASDSEDDDSDSDSDDSDDDDDGEKPAKTEEERKEILERKKEKIRKKYAALLGGLDGNDFGEADTNEDGETMEITFTPGLSDKAEELLRKKETDKEMEGLSPWEKYLEKRRKKAEDKKQQRKEEEIAEKKAARMRKAGIKVPEDEAEDAKKRQAELELLMIDEKDAKVSGISTASATTTSATSESGEGSKRKKGRQMSKKKRREAEEKEESGEFMVNTEDKRFESLYTSHDFAMDPTHPEFKKNKSTAAIMEKRNKERSKIAEDDEKEAKAMADAVKAAAKDPAASEKTEVMMLAESLKRRAKEAEMLAKKKNKLN